MRYKKNPTNINDLTDNQLIAQFNEIANTTFVEEDLTAWTPLVVGVDKTEREVFVVPSFTIRKGRTYVYTAKGNKAIVKHNEIYRGVVEKPDNYIEDLD